MASIVLSFVGQQDPVSDTTQEDGSIVSLMRHLVAIKQPIKQVLLLYTTGTQVQAELTQGWLMDAPFQLPQAAIALFPVDPLLSADPVNLLLAVQAARAGVMAARTIATPQDTLDLNASSGTPVMKSAWGLLQAAGYVPKSRLWQVRNPKEQLPDQDRVFQSNVAIVRQEFDVRVIAQQLRDYNYNGALVTLRNSGLGTPLLEALLEYGHCRLSLDFQRAQGAIAPTKADVGDRWWSEIQALAQRDRIALVQEAYFNAIVELKNRKFSDFLVRVSQFHEQVLHGLAAQYLAGRPALPERFEETHTFWQTLAHTRPDLDHFLQDYRYRGYCLRREGFPSRPVMQAIVEYAQHPTVAALRVMNDLCTQRNRYIHYFEGISELAEAENTLQTMRQVLAGLGLHDLTNPFNVLNQEITQRLEAHLAEGEG